MEFFRKKQRISPEECEQFLSRLTKFLSSELKLENRKIELSSRFKEDLGTDSFDALYIVTALEKEFDIEISDEDAEKFLTVGDVIEYLYKILRHSDVQENAT